MAEITVGTLYEVTEEIRYADSSQREVVLAQGSVGRVEELDDEGDCCFDFGPPWGFQWVLEEDLYKLKVQADVRNLEPTIEKFFEVVEEIHYNAGEADEVIIAKGVVGRLQEIDADGDCCLDFGPALGSLWVFKEDFSSLRMQVNFGDAKLIIGKFYEVIEEIQYDAGEPSEVVLAKGIVGRVQEFDDDEGDGCLDFGPPLGLQWVFKEDHCRLKLQADFEYEELIIGKLYEVTEDIHYNAGITGEVIIAKGMVGKVDHFDGEGDCYVDFGSPLGSQWVLKEDQSRLKLHTNVERWKRERQPDGQTFVLEQEMEKLRALHFAAAAEVMAARFTLEAATEARAMVAPATQAAAAAMVAVTEEVVDAGAMASLCLSPDTVIEATGTLPPVVVTPTALTTEAQVPDVETIVVGMPDVLSELLHVCVVTSEGTVGRFAVEPSSKIVELKAYLVSLCNVEPSYQTLFYGNDILEDDFRWIDIPVTVADGEAMDIQLRIVLENATIRKAVQDFCRGGKAKGGVERLYGQLSRWDTANVTNMSKLFQDEAIFNEDLSAWDVSNVTDMSRMFQGAASFNCDLNAWNVSRVMTMEGMFWTAESFNVNLTAWNVSNVTNMERMFQAASSFNGALSDWNVRSVTSMQQMFSNAKSFNGDISLWNVTNVRNMREMFCGARSFNSNIRAWNVSSGTYTLEMFNRAPIRGFRKPRGLEEDPITAGYIQEFQVSRRWP